ncbi:signal recognition particle subunit FFH/SRP54 (srp54) [Atopostipes suicloacalis DSM 15692]|uniref:Signal recognition particle protein n=1 Tax=Atopostipes suicloacalis DSM 15692 TaxID=1121025 RepID=A0A1M4UUG5_9LACT|nr:signal recognition particle protein [Atopostipes suicloacalis]SHE60401.1 signal recognition particle subunit FFH/SRP54 (srp54) [Atopostipes suicloacalis DSM 15692]
MAFEGLTGRLQDAFSSLRKKGKVSEQDVQDAMRQVRLALLEADVNYKVVREFVNSVREKAIGEEVLESLNGGQQVVKIVYDELSELMGGEQAEVVTSYIPPTVYMMTGLQGAGKTTTAGKLANFLRKSKNMKPMLIAADIYRPAAIDQLQTIGEQLNIPVFSMGDQVSPVEIAKKGLEEAKAQNRDLVIIDTAGRLHIDEVLMTELKEIKTAVDPEEIFLVVDAMTGQDAVNVADSFNDQLDISSVILTKLDGDTRGGAALSIRKVTGKPIKFTGTGEKLDALEPFYPDRMANRILGMGDLLTLIERAQEEVDEKRAEELAQKMAENRYDFNDFIEQMDQMRNMGPLEDLLKMIPGVGNIPGMDEFEMDEKELDYMKAIVMSMTPAEREDPDLLNQSRRRRVAEGSARSLNEVNRLIKQFKQSREMMAGMSGGKMPKGLGQMFGGKKGFGGGGNPLQGLGGGAPKSNRNRKKRKKIKRRK